MTPAALVASHAVLRDDPATTGIDLLVLHGSRARGEAADVSDWDLAYLAEANTDADADADPGALAAALTRVLATDAVDLVDLARASALLRFRAARDGVVVLERTPGRFVEFQEEAVRFRCDAGPVIRAAQDDVLAGLG